MDSTTGINVSASSTKATDAATVTRNPLALFMYLLLRDGLPVGKIVDLVTASVAITKDKEVRFDDPQAQILFNLALRLLNDLFGDLKGPTHGS